MTDHTLPSGKSVLKHKQENTVLKNMKMVLYGIEKSRLTVQNLLSSWKWNQNKKTVQKGTGQVCAKMTQMAIKINCQMVAERQLVTCNNNSDECVSVKIRGSNLKHRLEECDDKRHFVCQGNKGNEIFLWLIESM